MRLLIRLTGFLIIIICVAVVSLLMLPGDRIAGIAAQQISKQTGRAVTLEGDTKVTLYPILGVSAGRFVIGNAEWSDAGPMLSAEAVKIGIEPQALFGGEVRITGLEATNPQILLERAADGRVNWQVGVQGVAPSGQSGDGQAAASNPLSLTLDRALIKGGSLTFTDHAAGETTRLSGVDLDLRWPKYDGTAEFEISLLPLGLLDRKAIPDSERLHITGQLEQVGSFITGDPTTLTANLAAPGGTASFSGKAGTNGQAQGALKADFTDTARVLSALGVKGADIPAGLGRAASLSSLITVTDSQRIALRDMALQLDSNRLTGAADLDLTRTRPRLTAQLNAGALDLSGMAGSDANNTGGGGGAAQNGWSTAPIDASALSLMDGEFAFVADSINLGDLKLAKTRTLATLDRARLVLDIRELRSYDGLITGEFVVNNRSGLSVGGTLRAQDMNVQSLLRDSIGVSRLTGTAGGQVQFLGVGQSMEAIMNSLSGSGALKSGRGVIEGFDLDKLMRVGDLTGGTTVFDSLTASFTIAKGQMSNSDLLLSLPRASAAGAGRVGLGTRDIDYLFTPRLLDGDNHRGLAIPVRIKGPWANPRITPDLEKAIDLNLQKEKEELEARAKEEAKKLEQKAEDKVTKALQKELGVEAEEGQSVEDALKKTLENEAKKGLLKLFE